MDKTEPRQVDVAVVSHARCPPEVLFDLALDMDVHAASLAGTGERASTRALRVAHLAP